ncbi:sterol desaturase family protein [Mucilaginibacter sp. PAMB04274]|uniref:sterol desaturase family protein n=1 Tax=Mucilaginibacter sp. PAMB04274 TaxID=3138568 RepID=UPI0031F6E965
MMADSLLLFLAMDLAMYLFHYAIHHSFAYKWVHRLHHTYQDPTPVDLYVLHPLETVGFGALWLMVLCAYAFNFYAVAIYLTLNVLFGIIGHLGIEPLPKRVQNKMPLKLLGTSSFHHNHHRDEGYNFGFYTSIWDRLFNTYKH